MKETTVADRVDVLDDASWERSKVIIDVCVKDYSYFIIR